LKSKVKKLFTQIWYVQNVSTLMSLSPAEITVTVKLFAIYQEVLGVPELSYQFPDRTPVRAVLERLISERSELAQWISITQFGINLEFVDPSAPMRDRDEIVLIPPVSGG
jgi:molybdopterin synthase sulfur carrier subunit